MSAAEEIVADEIDEKPELSIREELEAARDEVVARQENEHVSDDKLVQSDGPARTDSRTRDATGKFTRESESGATGGQQSKAQQAAGTPPDGSAGQSQPSIQPVALPAPTSWKAEEKALWARVPAEVQHIINRREQEAHRAITAQDEVRSVGGQFIQTANEFAPVLQARGITPVAFFKEALGIVSQLGHPDPAVRGNMLRQLAHVNNVDPRFLIGPQQQPGASGQPQQAPNVPIDQLITRTVNERFQAIQQQQAQERERAEMQSTNSEIEAFRSKVDANGQPAYPYFDHVTSLMASILGGGVASTLEEAYELAVKAHPETSSLIAKAAEAAAKAAGEQRRKAENARRKAGSIRSGPGSPPAANGAGNRSIRDELKAAFEEARGRL